MRTTVPHISRLSLRSLRLRAGLSQGELATLLGMEKAAISHFERGRRVLSPTLRWALFAILGSFEPLDYKEVFLREEIN